MFTQLKMGVGKAYTISIILLIAKLIFATQKLPVCSNANTTIGLCVTTEKYNPLIPPQPKPPPCIIEPKVVISTIEINEQNHVVTLLIELKLKWIDHELNLESYHSQWFQLNGWHFNEVWNPSLHFDKLVNTKKISEFGKNNNIRSWFDNSTKDVYYSELMEVSFMCRLNFRGFPLDRHVCNFNFGESDFLAEQIEYSAPIIIYQTNRIDQENETLQISNDKFDVEVKQLKPFYKQFVSKRLTQSSTVG